MMKLLFIFSIVLASRAGIALGQCTVTKDAYGQVITSCQAINYVSESSSLNKQFTFLGSEFSSFPLWQEGRIRLDNSGQELTCLLAYNLFSQEVLCQLGGDLPIRSVTPDWFMVNGVEYTRQMTNVLGLKYKLYTTALNSGQNKVLKSAKARLIKTPIRNGYDKDHPFAGYYQVDQQYYIQKGSAIPQPITLTRHSVLSALGDHRAKLKTNLSKTSLTVDEVIKLVSHYDSLRVIAQLNSTSLSTDPAFNEVLESDLTYPVQAWKAQVYSRIYVGFEITDAGQVINIGLLSPENVGFGFKEAVEEALSKLSTTKSAYKGRYALPVAFTYSYHPAKELTFLPVNTVSDERLGDRILLNEFVVNQVVQRDRVSSREVWGYYK
ncbi:hypothetical protein [Spirosoma sp. KNUC1025]|uniref:hypothetical protein n=1 Tax=Spirosoma sp. KNUC1025 TaxID=2894082 RepID=UPI001E2D801F|nr:hypothetical protein [Spirosoma sp. KNUC1025]UFH57606.1 hypothetical protein LN737_30430 [Spirosoma sp. KNUC1025]